MKNNTPEMSVSLRQASPSEAMKRLYHEAFPADERRRWDQLIEINNNDPRFMVTLIFDESDGHEAGFITSWSLDDFVYIEHFATDQARRGCGLGQAALTQFMRLHAGSPVVLEVEPPMPDMPMTLRRVGFYERCGLRLHSDFQYIQPPYAPDLNEVELRLMTSGPVDLKAAASSIHRNVYGVGHDTASGSHRGSSPAASLLTAIVLLMTLLSSCSTGGNNANGNQSRILVASNEPVAALAAEIAGEGWETVTLVPAGTDPEMFEPSISALRKIDNASVAVTTGVSKTEKELIDRVLQQRNKANGPAIINASEGIDLITGSHGHAEPDPHLWTSPANLAAMAANIADGLAAADPASAPLFRHRADSLSQHYGRLHDSLKAVIEGAAVPRAFVVNHPSLSYLARDLGLRQIALGQENKEQSARGLLQSMQLIDSLKPRIMFVENQADSVKAAEIARRSGLSVVVLPTNTGHSESMIVKAVGRLTAQ